MTTENLADNFRKDFPCLEQSVNDKPLVYLDSAATAQKPQVVIDTVADFYKSYNANVHRGVHSLSQKATTAYETARDKLKEFIHAKKREELVFVRGTTEAINLVAQSFLRPKLQPGDEILITALEHHSNIVPWQLVCEQTGATLKVIPMNHEGELILDSLDKLMSSKTKLFSMVHISNSLGTINPVNELISAAKQHGIPTLVDGAQAAPHMPVDVQALDCDFYAFSGHKMFGPTGTGVLYAKAEHLEAMPPYQGGGEMISRVTFEHSDYNVIPNKFEAGTPNIAGFVGLGAAVDYLQAVDSDKVAAYENELLRYGQEALLSVPGVKLIGTAANKTSILSFELDDIHPHDAGTILDHEGIAVRAGHHCTMPVMDFFGVPATIRASLAFYNTREDIDRLIEGLHQVRAVFK